MFWSDVTVILVSRLSKLLNVALLPFCCQRSRSQQSFPFWFTFLFSVPRFGNLEMAAPQISGAHILDPSQMVSRNYIVKHLKEMLAKYAVAFTSNMKQGQLFELLRVHCVVNYARKIILDPATLRDAIGLSIW